MIQEGTSPTRSFQVLASAATATEARPSRARGKKRMLKSRIYLNKEIDLVAIEGEMKYGFRESRRVGSDVVHVRVGEGFM